MITANSTTPERTALYRFFNATGQLLYVGISGNTENRWRRHAESKPWWSDVADKTTEWLDSRPEALDAERVAIRAERPLYNHAHNTAAVLALLPAAIDEPLRPQFTPVVADDRNAAQRMAADIRALTMAGELPTGSRLPTTQDLCTRYKVSNVTVQRGLRILKSEGFAVGRNGSAVYVTSPAPQHLGQQEHYVVTEVSNGEATPPRQAAQALAAPEGELIQRQEVLVEVDERPIQIVVSYRRLNQAGSEPTEHLDQVTVRPPTTAERLALQIPEEVPVMRTFRQLLNCDGQALEVQIIVEPGNLCLRQYRAPIDPR